MRQNFPTFPLPPSFTPSHLHYGLDFYFLFEKSEQSEVEIYKRKQESKKKEIYHTLDKESDQENDQKKKIFRIKNLN